MSLCSTRSLALSPRTHPMFGCLAVYIEEKIVLILRDKRDETADNGVWLATTEEHHESLRREFPNMRSIQVFGKKVTGWQVLPADAPDFEEAALRACELIVARDPRIGKVPGARRASRSSAKKTPKSVSKQRLHVIKQRHEAEIHMQLLVAMKQRQAGIVGDEIYLRFLVSAQHHDIFDHS